MGLTTDLQRNYNGITRKWEIKRKDAKSQRKINVSYFSIPHRFLLVSLSTYQPCHYQNHDRRFFLMDL